MVPFLEASLGIHFQDSANIEKDQRPKSTYLKTAALIRSIDIISQAYGAYASREGVAKRRPFRDVCRLRIHVRLQTKRCNRGRGCSD